MREMILILEKWQTLVGAVLGGMFALGVALIVAWSATRRDRRIAATLLISDLTAINVTAQHLRNLAVAERVTADNYPLWVFERLSWRCPRLSNLFESQMIRVMDGDNALADHLSLLQKIYTNVKENIIRVEQYRARI